MSYSGYKLSAAAAAAEERKTTLSTASRPAPSNVTDGRFWGDEDWAALTAPPSEANRAETAARVSAVFYCTSLIAEVVGSLPLDLYDSKRARVEASLGDVLAFEPNPLQTAAEFWAGMAFAAVLRGVAFAEPTVGLDDVEIWPLNPEQTSVEWGERHFVVTYASEGRLRRMVPSQLFWFSGLAEAGMRPLVPWKMAKGSIDFQLALEVGGRSFFRNNRRPTGILSTEQKLDEPSIARIKYGVQQWKQGGIPVLEQGLKYDAVSGSNTDAQLVELIRQRTLEMARYWRIPRSMIGEEGGTAASQEQQALEFVKYTMRPWVRRIEQAISARLLPPDMKAARVRAKFNLDGLLRGDSGTQFRNAVLARTAGTHSVDDLRTDWFGLPAFDEDWSRDPRAPLNSNRAADSVTGGETAPQDKLGTVS